MRRPVLVVADDLQWVDDPSRATISFVARRLSRLHIAVPCAAREDELPETDARDLPRLELAGLRARDRPSCSPARRASRSTAECDGASSSSPRGIRSHSSSSRRRSPQRSFRVRTSSASDPESRGRSGLLRTGPSRVADDGNSRLQLFSSAGAFRTSIPTPSEAARGIAVAADVKVLVSVEGDRNGGYRRFAESATGWAAGGGLNGPGS
jgi:hypothetical protein